MNRLKAPGKAVAQTMGAPAFKETVVGFWTQRCRELLQLRNNLNREDLEYVAEKVATLRDERLKSCIAELIGWGDEERAELETFCAIALEVMKQTTPSKMREAALRVELRYHLGVNRNDYSEATEPVPPSDGS